MRTMGDMEGSRRYVALLRGVNVGGRNALRMDALARIFERDGCAEVRTYIQSGNVVFRCADAHVDGLADRIRSAIKAEADVDSPVVLRSAEDLGRIVDENPFLKRGEDERALHVSFMADAPDPDAVAALDPDRSPGDEYVVAGSEIYLFLPNGAARTKLTAAYFDKRLDTVTTQRNWRTVRKLVEMAGSE